MKTAIRNSEAQAVRSPVLQHFQSNPFRALRLAPNADASEGLWKAEQVLAMRRAGLAHPEPDLLPWLPELDEVEIQQAAQRLEEPFERLLARLFWFDLESDPNRDLLRSALVAPGSADAERYFAIATPNDEPADHQTAASAINAVNLLLLRAAAALHRALLPVGSGEGERAVQALKPLSWRDVGGVSVAKEPHKWATDRAEQNAQIASWRRALNGWRELLSAPALHAHLQIVVRELDDELIGEDDLDTIRRAILARLVDLVVAEIKAQLIAGRHDNVRALIQVATSCQLDLQMWRSAFRPLRSLFQAELAQLGTIPDDAQAVTLADLELHVTRLKALRQRWTAVDPRDHLGLTEMLDQAVRQVWRRLGSLDRTGLPLESVAELMRRIAQLAGSRSLWERIRDSLEPLTQNSEVLRCNYCHRNEPIAEASAVLKGRREVDRTWYVVGTVVRIQTQARLIPRCRRCAELHHYIFIVGWWVSALLTSLTIAISVASVRSGMLDGLVGFWMVVGALALAWFLAAGARLLEARALTPPGEAYFQCPQEDESLSRHARRWFRRLGGNQIQVQS